MSTETTSMLPRAANGLLRVCLAGLAVFGPMVAGVVPWQYGAGLRALAVGAVFGGLFGVLWLLSGSTSAPVRRAALLAVACLLLVTLIDTVARPLTARSDTPGGTIVDWPPMPLVRRYIPNVRVGGMNAGELTRARSMKKYREYHAYPYATDRFGFRNDGPPDGPLDVIVVGGSYAVGDNTAQDKRWSTLLSTAHGLHVYNLGVAGDSSWTAYANLLLEGDRLRIKPQGTVVLWMMVAASYEVLGACHPVFRKDELPWRAGWRTFAPSLRGYQQRSPLGFWRGRLGRYLFERPDTDVVAKPFLDGTDVLFDLSYARDAEHSLAALRDHESYPCVRETIAAMKRLASARHLTVAIMLAPSKEEVYSWVLRDARPWSTPASPSGLASLLREIAREEQMPVVDMKPAMIQASERVYRASKRLLYWRDDTHWNVEGNREAAAVAYSLYLSVASGKPQP